MTLRKQLWGSGLKFQQWNDTAETVSAVSMTPLKFGWQPLKPKNDFESPYLILKRTSSKTISCVNIPKRYNNFKQKKGYGLLNFIFGFSGVIDTAETNFGDFWSNHLGEYEAICETVLAC
jgi:hypothetical protein